MAKIKWKTKKEIEEEKKKPKEPTETDLMRDYLLELEFRMILLELGI